MASGSDGSKYFVDNSFRNEEEDTVRLYGSTKESNPIQNKKLSAVRDSRGALDEDGKLHEDESNSALIETDETDHFFPEHRLSFPGSINYGDGSFADGASISAKTWPLEESWLRHPKVRENWRVVLASFLLVLIGIALFITGITVQSVTGQILHSFVFFIIGLICMIPGAYHLIYIYCAVRGRPGFSFYNLPVLK